MFSNKKIIFSILILSVCFIAQAQTCNRKFTGRVINEIGESIVGAQILLQPQHSAITDVEGSYHFDNLCPGVYSVVVQYLGYIKQEFTITINNDVEQTIELHLELKTLDEVVIKEKLEHAENAQNYSVLSEKQLAETAGKTLGESLKEIPGVSSIQSGPGIFKPVIHGVHSQRVLILNYGIRQEGQQWGAEHAPEIDPFIASNIVVIKDASAIKYGTDALGGVVVVNPPELPQKAGLGGSLNSVLQSNGRSGVLSGMLEGGIKKYDGWGWRLQGTAKRSGDFHTPTYSLTNTGIKELDFSAATGYHSEKLGAEVFFSHFQSELGILKGTAIGNLEDLETAMTRPEPQYTTGFSYLISEPRQEVSHNLLKVNGHVSTDQGEWRIQYGFQTDHRKEFDFRPGTDLSQTPALNLQLQTHTLEAEWGNKNSEKTVTSFGVTGMAQLNSNVYGTKRIPFIPNFNNLSGGAFGITKIMLNRWTLDGGIRYDYRFYHVAGFDYKNSFYSADMRFHNFSATTGASVQLNPEQSLNFSLSSAWRPPSVAELYSLGTHQSAAAIEYGLLLNDSTNEVMNIKDVNFKNEQAVKFVGTHHFQRNKFQLETTGYVNYILNYIYLRPTGVTQNIRGAYPYLRYTQTDALFLGIDISGIWQLNEHFKVNPKASLLRASDYRNHDYLVFIPSNRYDVTLRYDEPGSSWLKNFFIESKVKYTARQHRAPRVVTVSEILDANDQGINLFQEDNSNFDFMAAPKGYWLVGLATGFSVSAQKMKYDFRLSAENLFNQTYREYTNRFRYYANEMGSNYVLSVKCSF